MSSPWTDQPYGRRRQQRDAEAVLGEVGEAVAGDLELREVAARRVVRRALDDAELHLVGRARRVHGDREAHLQRRGGPRASRSRSGTRAAATPRRAARPGASGCAPDRSLEGNFGAQRVGKRHLGAVGRRAVAPRLEMERVEVPGLEGGRAVLVELEHVAGCGHRLAPARQVDERASVPSRPTTARRRAFSRTKPSSSCATRTRRGRRPAVRPARRRLGEPQAAGRRATSRRSTPTVLTTSPASERSRSAPARRLDLGQVALGACVDLADRRAREDVVEVVEQQRPPGAVELLARPRPRPPRRPASSASCSARSARRLARLVRACVV